MTLHWPFAHGMLVFHTMGARPSSTHRTKPPTVDARTHGSQVYL